MAEDSIKLAILEQKLLDFGNIINKLDSAIEKISEVNSNITKMLAVHEERIEQCNKTDDLISKMINDLRDENKEQHEEVSKRIDKVEEKLQDVSRIKWMTIGTGIVLAVLATAFSTLASGWWTPSEMQMLKQGHIHQQNVP